jgi:hypothetical protein
VATQESGICLGGLVPRSTEAVIALEIVGRRLTLWLRHELGLVYSVHPSYLALDAETAFFFVAVDALEANVSAVATEFLAVWRALRDQGPSFDDLERARRSWPLPKDSDPGAVARSELHRIATDRLLGFEHLPLETLFEQREEALAENVQEAFATVFDRAAIIGPERSGLTIPYRTRPSAEPVEGQRFRSKNKKPEERELRELVIGPKGISGHDGERWVTILWSDFALARQLEDMTWDLLSRTGVWMSVMPSGWKRGGWLADMLEAGIPEPARVTRRDTSDPAEDVPAETASEWRRDLRLAGEFLRLMLPKRFR